MSPLASWALITGLTLIAAGLYKLFAASETVDRGLAPVETEHDQAEQRQWKAEDAALARARRRAETRQLLDELDAIYALPSVEEPHR